VVTAVLLLAGTVLTAPVVEELYFRGYLLPRLPAAAAAEGARPVSRLRLLPRRRVVLGWYP
jgi:hypothetical protein